MIRFVFCSFLFCMLLLAGVAPGCTREYSFEGGDTQNVPTPLPRDTLVNTDSVLPGINPCVGCNDVFIEGQWSLKINGVLLCGKIDTAILGPERNGFTFFGPSLCSLDSGLIITVRLDGEKLDNNRQDVVLQKASIYYYDKVGGLYVVQSVQGKPFAVTILSYNHTTKEVTGTFSGTGYTKADKPMRVTDGKWKTYLH